MASVTSWRELHYGDLVSAWYLEAPRPELSEEHLGLGLPWLDIGADHALLRRYGDKIAASYNSTFRSQCRDPTLLSLSPLPLELRTPASTAL